MPVQLTVANSVTDQINLIANSDKPTELQLRRVKNEIEKVKQADIAQYYMLLGMFYSVTGDVEASISNHDKSLRLSSQVIFLENYAFSLKRLGKSEEALNLLLKAFDVSPTEDVFEEVGRAMIHAGVFSGFETVVERFVRANPEVNLNGLFSVHFINNALEQLSRALVPLDEFKLSMELVRGVLLQKGYADSIEAMTFCAGTFDDVPHVDVCIKLKSPTVTALFEINEAIADVMASAENIESWNRIVFTVCDYHDFQQSIFEVA